MITTGMRIKRQIDAILDRRPATHQHLLLSLTGLGFDRELVRRTIDRGIDRKWWTWSKDRWHKLSVTPKLAQASPELLALEKRLQDDLRLQGGTFHLDRAKTGRFQPFATWLTEDGYARVATRLKKNEREREAVYQEHGGNPRAMASTIWRLRQMLAEAEKRNGTDD